MNRVRAFREQQGLSQLALATACGLSRQSVHAIESGRSSPAVDVALRLARALDCPVEELFGDGESAPSLSAEPVGEVVAGRVALTHIAGRWLSYSLSADAASRAADAIAGRAARGRVALELLRSEAEARENIVLMGCASALGVLADRLNGRAGSGRFTWLPRSSTSALRALDQRHTHLAGVHLLDAKTGEANVPDVRRLASRQRLVVITLASWEAGLVLAPGNPKRIARVAQLAAKGVRLVAREAGSGARRLLDAELRRAGAPASLAQHAAVQASGHLDVARAVAFGAADAGVATRDAALAFGLAFVPLAEERYDLVVGHDDLSDARLSRLFDALSGAAFRRELSALGYDSRSSGTRVADVLAA